MAWLQSLVWELRPHIKLVHAAAAKKKKKKDIWSSPVVQEVRDLALSLLWLWSQL